MHDAPSRIRAVRSRCSGVGCQYITYLQFPFSPFRKTCLTSCSILHAWNSRFKFTAQPPHPAALHRCLISYDRLRVLLVRARALDAGRKRISGPEGAGVAVKVRAGGLPTGMEFLHQPDVRFEIGAKRRPFWDATGHGFRQLARTISRLVVCGTPGDRSSSLRLAPILSPSDAAPLVRDRSGAANTYSSVVERL